MLELSCDVHLVFVLCTWCIPLFSNKIDYLSKNEALTGSMGWFFHGKVYGVLRLIVLVIVITI